MLLFFLAGAALLLRLGYIQLMRGGDFARAAVSQRSLRQVCATGRGQILDRHGKSLLDSRTDLALVSFEPLLEQETKEVLSGYIGDEKRSAINVISDRNHVRYLMNRDAAGLVPVWLETRYGPGLLAPHVVGFVQRETVTGERPFFRETTFTARSGLELYFDQYLAASRPSSLVAVVDAQSRLIRGLGFREWRDDDADRPYSVVTTLDRNIQAAVQQIGATHIRKGAIVVVEPHSGDILALASFPDYSPAGMFFGPTRAELAAYDEFNRVLASCHPGSVFKVVLAAAAIDLGRADTTYYCTGSVEVGNTNVGCFGRRAHGELDLTRALAVSCNSYFVHLGQLLGREDILHYARCLGLGQPAGITLHGERAGRLPTVEEMPHPGYLANLSIGQGTTEVTPLQLARMMTIIANGGRDIRPRLVNRIIDRSGNTVLYYPVRPGTRVLSSVTVSQLLHMLKEVTLAGTARQAQSDSFVAAGKSGTAQTGRPGELYYWFAGLAPADGKPLVAVIFAEEKSDLTAAGIFGAVMEEILPLWR
jgi:cell division protein FtsI/penicillin-binding protein 2